MTGRRAGNGTVIAILTRIHTSLVARFALTSAVVFAIVGAVLIARLGASTEQRLEDVAISQAVAVGQTGQSLVTFARLPLPDIEEDAEEPRLVALLAALGPQLEPLESAQFAMRSADGELIFATTPTLETRPTELARATTGTVTYHDDDAGLIRTQMGIEFVDGGRLLLEIAQDHQAIHAAVASERLRYGVIVIVGLAVLWLVLLPLLLAASRRLRDQAEHLRELLAKEQQTTTELRRLDEMKNAFLTSVSHELRTPLTLMRGSTEMLVSRGDQLAPVQREQLYGMLQRHTTRLTRLVDDLVDLDRLTQEQVDARRTLVDVSALARDTVARLDTAGREVRLPNRPASTEADPTMVSQIVENLVGNALKYTPDGSPIAIDIEPTDDGWLLAVEDHGPGIPEEERAAVFEPFQRLDDHHSPGTGIGLSLVARFAQAHGGWADVVDGQGGGARFRVHLPGPHVGGVSVRQVVGTQRGA